MSEPEELVVVQEDTKVEVTKVSSGLTLTAAGPQGIRGPQGVPGAAGGSVIEHTQSVPAATWTITHNLNRIAFVRVVDDSGDEIISDTDQSDPNTVSITFATPTSGKAVIS